MTEKEMQMAEECRKKHIREYAREYRKKHRDHLLEYYRNYRKKNRERLREYNREYGKQYKTQRMEYWLRKAYEEMDTDKESTDNERGSE